MTLTNQNLIVLSKFASKAKKHIGLVKVADMVNNEQYAIDIFAQAALSANQELVDLTKKISQELELGINLINAIESYIYSLKAINRSEEFLDDTNYFLIKLTHHLYGVSIDGMSYRQAVDKLLQNVDINDRVFCINLAREFYRCWRSANRSLAELNKDQITKLITQKEEFIKLWENIDYEFLSDEENESLTRYTESMRQKGLVEKDIMISQKIAKVILLELRSDPSVTDDSYRAAIDRTLALFERLDLKTFFLIVSREFYHFWVISDQQLISNVLSD
ncbi:MAG: hypothetical protein CTY37_01205 [Methylotenera sp.]|nr:MAG: hypothetical protein CTY37_01205 [Methylotenera sp.]